MKVTEFKIDGDPQVYKLAFDFNSLVDAETLTGLNLMRPLANLSQLTAGEIRGLLYAMLKPAHPQVLLSEAGDLFSRDMETVTGALAEVLGASGKEEEEAEAPTAPTVAETIAE